MGLTLEAYHQTLAEARGSQLIYLDEMGDEDAEEGFLERHRVVEAAQPAHMLRDDRFRAALIEAIDDLPEREKAVMGMYYEQEMNLKEIGAVLGVTESRISQLHSQAVARLRTKLRGWA
jgi:RNA polymerase sigma factor for flagellar operon FliA